MFDEHVGAAKQFTWTSDAHFLGARSKRRRVPLTVHSMVSFEESFGACQDYRKTTGSESLIDAYTARSHCCCRAVSLRSVSWKMLEDVSKIICSRSTEKRDTVTLTYLCGQFVVVWSTLRLREVDVSLFGIEFGRLARRRANYQRSSILDQETYWSLSSRWDLRNALSEKRNTNERVSWPTRVFRLYRDWSCHGSGTTLTQQLESTVSASLLLLTFQSQWRPGCPLWISLGLFNDQSRHYVGTLLSYLCCFFDVRQSVPSCCSWLWLTLRTESLIRTISTKWKLLSHSIRSISHSTADSQPTDKQKSPPINPSLWKIKKFSVDRPHAQTVFVLYFLTSRRGVVCRCWTLIPSSAVWLCWNALKADRSWEISLSHITSLFEMHVSPNKIHEWSIQIISGT